MSSGGTAKPDVGVFVLARLRMIDEVACDGDTAEAAQIIQDALRQAEEAARASERAWFLKQIHDYSHSWAVTFGVRYEVAHGFRRSLVALIEQRNARACAGTEGGRDE